MFAENLKSVREKIGLTKAQAAQRLGMSSQQYGVLERVGSNPTMKTIERVARSFGVSVNRLTKGQLI